MSKAKELYEKLNKFNEEFSEDFRLTDLEYKITYTSGESYEKIIPQVDTLNYKLYDLGLAQIADIIITAAEVNNEFTLKADSIYIEYDAVTGIIRSKEPIALFRGDVQKATISFEMTLWTHPERYEI